MNARICFQTGESLAEEPDFSQDELDGAIADLIRENQYAISEMVEGSELTELQLRGAIVCALEETTPANLISLGLSMLKRVRESLDDNARCKLKWGDE